MLLNSAGNEEGDDAREKIYREVMEQMFENIEGVRVYIDDIIVWGSTEAEHDKRLAEVQQHIEHYGLQLNTDKCMYRNDSVTVLDDVLSADGIRPSDDKIEVIMNMQKPSNREELQRFLGCVKIMLENSYQTCPVAAVT